MAYTDMERRILDMWPKFEDGNYVQLGDKAVANSGENSGKEFIVRNVYFENGHGKLRSSVSDGCYWNWKSADMRVKRSAPKVLDIDGVEVNVGDTVWHEDGREFHVIGFGDVQDGETTLVVEYAAEPTKLGEVRCLSVAHTRPDSWERLEKDAAMSPWSYCNEHGLVVATETFATDIVRRAKAIAEKEAGL